MWLLPLMTKTKKLIIANLKTKTAPKATKILNSYNAIQGVSWTIKEINKINFIRSLKVKINHPNLLIKAENATAVIKTQLNNKTKNQINIMLIEIAENISFKARHELTHMLIHNAFKGIRIWMN